MSSFLLRKMLIQKFVKFFSLVAITVIFLAGVIHFFSAPMANYILANSIPNETRQFPPTAYAIPQSSSDVRLIGGRGDGLSCSIPAWLESLAFPTDDGAAPPSLQNRQACIFHDYCYRHGHATYGYSQTDCDQFLQDHAFKLCRYTSQYKKDAQQKCQTRARLVTLGVTFGGSKSFRTNDSTYFEFDARPFRSRGHTVYRIAQTPSCWRSLGAALRSTYLFHVQPSGMEVEILGLPTEISPSDDCPAKFEIPGKYNRFLAAPTVSRTGDKDWFVWWRRMTDDDRRGKISLLAPALASPQDWQNVNRDKPITINYGDKKRPAFISIENDYWNTTEFHNRRWQESAEDQIQLTGVMTHTCKRKLFREDLCKGMGGLLKPENEKLPKQYVFAQPVLCYRDLKIPLILSQPRIAKADREPLALNGGPRASISIECQKGLKTLSVETLSKEPYKLQRPLDRYRSLTNPPMDMREDKQHYIALARRGASNGDGYTNALTLRRFGHISNHQDDNSGRDTGQSFGQVVLLNHTEMDEPILFMNGQEVRESGILSIKADHQENTIWNWLENRLQLGANPLLFTFWKMPILNDEHEPLGLEKHKDLTESITVKVTSSDGQTLSSDYFLNPPILTGGSSAKAKAYFWMEDIDGSGGIKIATVPFNAKILRQSKKSIEVKANIHFVPLCKRFNPTFDVTNVENRKACRAIHAGLSINAADMNGDGQVELVALRRNAKNGFVLVKGFSEMVVQ